MERTSRAEGISLLFVGNSNKIRICGDGGRVGMDGI